jgi:sugar lactone lactonase YvrE
VVVRVSPVLEIGAMLGEGPVWVGLFGGWGVRRYGADGALLYTVPFPVANVTKIAFGGEDLSMIYATTARKGLSEEALQAQPLAGQLFAFEAGGRGQRGYLAAIEP